MRAPGHHPQRRRPPAHFLGFPSACSPFGDPRDARRRGVSLTKCSGTLPASARGPAPAPRPGTSASPGGAGGTASYSDRRPSGHAGVWTGSSGCRGNCPSLSLKDATAGQPEPRTPRRCLRKGGGRGRGGPARPPLRVPPEGQVLPDSLHRDVWAQRPRAEGDTGDAHPQGEGTHGLRGERLRVPSLPTKKATSAAGERAGVPDATEDNRSVLHPRCPPSSSAALTHVTRTRGQAPELAALPPGPPGRGPAARWAQRWTRRPPAPRDAGEMGPGHQTPWLPPDRGFLARLPCAGS